MFNRKVTTKQLSDKRNQTRIDKNVMGQRVNSSDMWLSFEYVVICAWLFGSLSFAQCTPQQQQKMESILNAFFTLLCIAFMVLLHSVGD